MTKDARPFIARLLVDAISPHTADDCLQYAMRGSRMLKVRSGVAPRFFYLSADLATLHWVNEAAGKPRSRWFPSLISF